MKIETVELLGLLPRFLQADPTAQGLCAAIQPLVRRLGNRQWDVLIYPRLEEQPDEVLDELAWQYHVDGYDALASREEKCRLIRASVDVHRYKGSVYAVEQIVQAVFGGAARVTEWFDYQGTPKHFKVEVDCVDRGAGEADILRAESLVMLSKNLRSILDSITLILVGRADLAVGAAAIQSETVEVFPQEEV